MVQRILTVLEDDIDGSEAAETVQFALDGTSYEIDLNDKHARQLRQALGKYIDGARKVGASKKKKSGGSKKGSDENAEIRKWARAHGHEIGDRGRIPAEVKAAFEAAA